MNNISGTLPPSLSALTVLESLGLDNNKLSGNLPPSLTALNSSLTHLALSTNNFTGEIPPVYSRLTALSSLSVSFEVLFFFFSSFLTSS
jgi:Leucine-rich repeat (LRR) protein